MMNKRRFIHSIVKSRMGFLHKFYHKIKRRLRNQHLLKQISIFVKNNNGKISFRNNQYTILLPDRVGPCHYILRKNSSDLEVFGQIIIKEEYKDMLSLLSKNSIKPKTIVDAGSNIGLAMLYFKQHFLSSKIICIEPDPGNTHIITQNININRLEDIYIEKAGLFDKESYLKISRNYRDGAEWSFQVVPVNSKTDLKATTIPSLREKYNIKYIDLLKIDIEGAEAHLFSNWNHLVQFLPFCRSICLEVHEEYISYDSVSDILMNAQFECYRSKDLILAINKNL